MPHPFPWTVKLSDAVTEARNLSFFPTYVNRFPTPTPDYLVPDAQVLDDDGVAIPGFDWLDVKMAEAIVGIATTNRDHVMHERLLSYADHLHEQQQKARQHVHDHIQGIRDARR